MTRREEFAKTAMSALLTHYGVGFNDDAIKRLTDWSVSIADSMLEKLDETTPKNPPVVTKTTKAS